jgi:hypothetical protein
MWKAMCATYKSDYPNFELGEENFKKRLRKTLKELKIRTSN